MKNTVSLTYSLLDKVLLFGAVVGIDILGVKEELTAKRNKQKRRWFFGQFSGEFQSEMICTISVSCSCDFGNFSVYFLHAQN